MITKLLDRTKNEEEWPHVLANLNSVDSSKGRALQKLQQRLEADSQATTVAKAALITISNERLQNRLEGVHGQLGTTRSDGSRSDDATMEAARIEREDQLKIEEMAARNALASVQASTAAERGKLRELLKSVHDAKRQEREQAKAAEAGAHWSVKRPPPKRDAVGLIIADQCPPGMERPTAAMKQANAAEASSLQPIKRPPPKRDAVGFIVADQLPRTGMKSTAAMKSRIATREREAEARMAAAEVARIARQEERARNDAAEVAAREAESSCQPRVRVPISPPRTSLA